jgi:hypothetical protein
MHLCNHLSYELRIHISSNESSICNVNQKSVLYEIKKPVKYALKKRSTVNVYLVYIGISAGLCGSCD